MSTNTLNGFYGSESTPCEVFTYETRHGTWYCAEGSQNVNLSATPLGDGVNIELVEDCDTFTWSGPIGSETELEEAVDA